MGEELSHVYTTSINYFVCLLSYVQEDGFSSHGLYVLLKYIFIIYCQMNVMFYVLINKLSCILYGGYTVLEVVI